MNVKVSLVLATLNRVDFLKECLESYESLGIDKELIVVDGGSTDGSLEILSSYATMLISEPDQSVYDAWNKGLKLVTGDWVLFLNSDDFLINENIDRIFSNIPNTFQQIISFDVFVNYKDGDKLKQTRHSPIFSFREIISEPIYFNGYAFHKNVFSDLGGFMMNSNLCADQSFLWKCVAKHYEVLHFNLVGYSYSSHPFSLTLNRRDENLFYEEMITAQSIFESTNSLFVKEMAEKWVIWETISLRFKQRLIRVLFRLLYFRTTRQGLYSIFRKIGKYVSPIRRMFDKE